MYVDSLSIEVDSPGDFALGEVIRNAGDNILISANAQSRFAQVQSGYLYVQLLLRSPSPDFTFSCAQLLAGPTWDMFNPSWTGHLQLSDDMFITCRAASVSHNIVRFNLSFLHPDKGGHIAQR